MSYKEWMLAIGQELEAKTGFDYTHFGDQHYWEAWKDGQDVDEMVERILEDEGWTE